MNSKLKIIYFAGKLSRTGNQSTERLNELPKIKKEISEQARTEPSPSPGSAHKPQSSALSAYALGAVRCWNTRGFTESSIRQPGISDRGAVTGLHFSLNA